MKISPEELRRWQLHSQYLTSKTDLLEASAGLCGFQAQYPVNARHAARLRVKQPQKDGGLAKSWTLRGTLHHIPLTDLPLYVSRRGNWRDTAYFRWLSGQGRLLPRQRMERFAQMVLEGLSGGPLSRDELKALCRQAGMTQQEEPQVFDGWGGVIRLLCEAGELYCSAYQPRMYCRTPPLPPVEESQARLVLTQRYFAHYGPATLRDAAYFFRWPQKSFLPLLDRLKAQPLQCQDRTYYYLDRRPARLPKTPDCLFLAGFDPLLLGYEKTESLYLSPQYLRRVFNLTGIVFPTLLLHGQIAGRWKELPRAIRLEPFFPLSAEDTQAVQAQAAKLWPEKPLLVEHT